MCALVENSEREAFDERGVLRGIHLHLDEGFEVARHLALKRESVSSLGASPVAVLGVAGLCTGSELIVMMVH